MNAERKQGSQMHSSKLKPGLFSFLTFVAASVCAQHSNIECVASSDGTLQATMVWRKAIGEGRADEICNNFVGREISDQKARRPGTNGTKVPTVPTLAPAPAVKNLPSPQAMAGSDGPNASVTALTQSSETQNPLQAPTIAAPLAEAVTVDSVRNLATVTTKQESTFTLNEGEPIHLELERWALSSGWKKFAWTLPYSWRVFSNTTISDESALKAISKVIDYLRDEGKPVRMSVFQGNGVLEVDSSELLN